MLGFRLGTQLGRWPWLIALADRDPRNSGMARPRSRSPHGRNAKDDLVDSGARRPGQVGTPSRRPSTRSRAPGGSSVSVRRCLPLGSGSFSSPSGYSVGVQTEIRQRAPRGWSCVPSPDRVRGPAFVVIVVALEPNQEASLDHGPGGMANRAPVSQKITRDDFKSKFAGIQGGIGARSSRSRTRRSRSAGVGRRRDPPAHVHPRSAAAGARPRSSRSNGSDDRPSPPLARGGPQSHGCRTTLRRATVNKGKLGEDRRWRTVSVDSQPGRRDLRKTQGLRSRDVAIGEKFEAGTVRAARHRGARPTATRDRPPRPPPRARSRPRPPRLHSGMRVLMRDSGGRSKSTSRMRRSQLLNRLGVEPGVACS